MKKITNRALSVLLLAAMVIVGMALYLVRYVDQGEDWALYFSRLNAGANGEILDRNGVMLASFSANEKALSRKGFKAFFYAFLRRFPFSFPFTAPKRL